MKEKSQVRIFISYRRKGGIDTARWLHDQLRDRGYDVFLDMEGLRSGAFNQALYHEIKNRNVFLMVLSKDSLNRCGSKNDWVRQELSYAFRCGLNVIPVMKEDFEFPKRLPQDISPIRSCNGLRISYQFFDAFLEKLEEYILSEPESNYNFIPDPDPDIDWVKYAAAGVAAVALLAGVFLLGKGCDNDPSPKETNASVSTTAPETTAPHAAEGQQTAAQQELGNSTGNQCNGGIASIGYYALYSRGHNLNTLGDQKYYFDVQTNTLRVHKNGEKSTEIFSDEHLNYFLTTTDWVYYAIEAGETAKLYRAPRPEGSNPVTGSEELASGFLADNNIMIDGEFAYYWRYNKGIYRLDLATKEESPLLELEATWTADTIGKSGNWVYLFTDNSISRVHVEDSRYETVFKLEEHFADAAISAANADGEWLYFSVTDLGEDVFHHYDRVYRMHTDGSEMTRVFVADTSVCRVKRICVTDTNVHFDMECSEDSHCHYIVSQSTWKITGCEMAHAQPNVETPCVTVGNTVTNLCNQAVAAPKTPETTMYKTSNTAVHYNLFTEAEVSYCYDTSARCILVTWTEDGSYKSTSLLNSVTCHYLYVTPDWLYFVLEDKEVNTLYRAQNNMEAHTMGELQAVASGIFAHNGVAIRNDTVYYWKNPDGLYKARTDGSGAEVLFDNGGNGIGAWTTFHVDSDKLYFRTVTGGIYGVSLEDGTNRSVYSTKELPGNMSHAVKAGSKFYYVMQYITDGIRTAPDELWSVNMDGSDPTLVATFSQNANVLLLNAGNSTIFMKVEQDGVTKLYKVPSTGELKEVYTYE